jgi:hypothetical protein
VTLHRQSPRAAAPIMARELLLKFHLAHDCLDLKSRWSCKHDA